MKTAIALAAAMMLSGCSTVMNDRMQQVEFTAPTPTEFTVTGKAGRTVSGVTPAVLKLDSAVGAFRCERYTVRVNGRTIDVNTGIQGWFWFGSVMSLTSLIVDASTGNMCRLPGRVSL